MENTIYTPLTAEDRQTFGLAADHYQVVLCENPGMPELTAADAFARLMQVSNRKTTFLNICKLKTAMSCF